LTNQYKANSEQAKQAKQQQCQLGSSVSVTVSSNQAEPIAARPTSAKPITATATRQDDALMTKINSNKPPLGAATIFHPSKINMSSTPIKSSLLGQNDFGRIFGG
jgi:hypothetical protein